MKTPAIIMILLLAGTACLFSEAPRSTHLPPEKLQDLLGIESWEFEVPQKWGDQINITLSEYDAKGEVVNSRTIHVELEVGRRLVTISIMPNGDDYRVVAHLGSDLASQMLYHPLPLENKSIAISSQKNPGRLANGGYIAWRKSFNRWVDWARPPTENNLVLEKRMDLKIDSNILIVEEIERQQLPNR